jgi:tripartite-type tricarboxylate transporter receptor subunit TctC
MNYFQRCICTTFSAQNGLASLLRVYAVFFAAVMLAAGSTPTAVQAQASYPNKPIRLIVGFAAGGPNDIVARIAAAKLTEILGQQVLVENRAGASGNIATDAVARAPKDGYTLLSATITNAVNETLFKNLPFKFERDLVAVAPLAETGNVLVVHPSLDVKTVPDLIALAKSRPGEVLYATAGKGTATHLAGELFNMMAGVKLVPVHYKGGGATTRDLLSGEVKVMFSTIPPVLGFIQVGKLRGVATTGLKRDPSLPDLPTVAESGLPGFEMSLWFGLAAPAGTPHEVVDRLAAAARQAVDSPDVKATLAKQGLSPMIATPDEFGTFIHKEIDKWGKVVKVVGTIDE